MGIHDRDYYRDQGGGQGQFGSWASTAVGTIILLNVGCWFLQLMTRSGPGDFSTVGEWMSASGNSIFASGLGFPAGYPAPGGASGAPITSCMAKGAPVVRSLHRARPLGAPVARPLHRARPPGMPMAHPLHRTRPPGAPVARPLHRAGGGGGGGGRGPPPPGLLAPPLVATAKRRSLLQVTCATQVS